MARPRKPDALTQFSPSAAGAPRTATSTCWACLRRACLPSHRRRSLNGWWVGHGYAPDAVPLTTCPRRHAADDFPKRRPRALRSVPAASSRLQARRASTFATFLHWMRRRISAKWLPDVLVASTGWLRSDSTRNRSASWTLAPKLGRDSPFMQHLYKTWLQDRNGADLDRGARAQGKGANLSGCCIRTTPPAPVGSARRS